MLRPGDVKFYFLGNQNGGCNEGYVSYRSQRIFLSQIVPLRKFSEALDHLKREKERCIKIMAQPI